MARLGGQLWLNDNLIDMGIKEILASNKISNDPLVVHAFSSHFYDKLMEKITHIEYALVRRWTKNVNIFEMDISVVVNNIRKDHWYN